MRGHRKVWVAAATALTFMATASERASAAAGFVG